ncbi:hypothetical protein [Pseudomonas sp. DP16D-R1]|uniref:hypothetical protein n=1 Tax=Pseudomonas sp. DP16D-R1 TaxID=2075551 RepID=UPI00130485C5
MAAVFHRLLPDREGLAPRSLPKVGRLAFSGPVEYLGKVGEKADGLTVGTAIDHGARTSCSGTPLTDVLSSAG